MAGPTRQRTQSDPSVINNNLENAHKLAGRACGLLVTMLVKRVFWRSYLDEAVLRLEAALKLLKELQGDQDGRTKN